MEKKLITAIALSILVVVAFQYFAVRPVPSGNEAATKDAIAQKTAEIMPTVNEPQNLPEETEYEAATDKYILTFSNIGGSLKDIRLKEYNALNSREPLELVRIFNPKEQIFNISDLTSGQIFDLAEYRLKDENPTIIWTLTTKDYEIRKKYILHKDNYGIDLELSVKNISGNTKDFSYSIVGGAGLTEKNEQDRRLIEAAAKIDGKIVGLKRAKRGERIINIGMVGWGALKNKYFSIILKPFVSTRGEF